MFLIRLTSKFQEKYLESSIADLRFRKIDVEIPQAQFAFSVQY